ncbi:hypothetical protein BS47DRAFT_1482266 [Hydnum rufescens UP504]|uniref:Uncharacterized protein n=1 Tax=Hydnum rufescens UP504 TaxID=1448309 RepID=A0A9P6E172_9AGAM|nr:hypothetical protein BS47DRAFT_1482266 [Hydnum rufescens UP504]
MFFTLSIIGFVALVLLLSLYHRSRVLSFLPLRLVALLPSNIQLPHQLRPYVLLSTFESQRDAGMSSTAFDLEANLAGDSRLGLDERGAEEVRSIMQTQGVTFDQARLIRHKQILARNGIDPTGMPLDSKAITHL